MRLVMQIRPLLAGLDPGVQSAALADLLAMWLAGHITDSPQSTEAFREALLADHIELVRRLVPVNEQMLLEGVRKQSS